MHFPARIFLLRMIDELMEIALQRPIAAGGVRVEPTARVHREVRRLLHRGDGEIAGRLEDDGSLATDPGDDGGPVFVVMPPTGLTLLAASTRAASQRFLPALFRLALVAGSMIQVVGFDRPLQLPLHFVGQRRIPQPPAPPIARPYMHPQLSGNAARGTRQAQEKRRKNPVHDRALAAIQERAREVIEGALAGLLFTAVALQAGPVVIGAPGPDVVALTPRTLEGPIFPAQPMDVRLTRCGVEEVVQMRHNRHGWAS